MKALAQKLSTIEPWLKDAFGVAFALAQKAFEAAEVPVGACILQNKQIVGRGFNQILKQQDPTAHAELLALREACKVCQSERIPGSILVSTLEPCVMCSGALILARVQEVHVLAVDDKLPALRRVLRMKGHNHTIQFYRHSIEEWDSAALLKNFFQIRRKLN